MFVKLLNKLLSLAVLLRYGTVPEGLKYFYRDTFRCQLVQWKYFFRDYVVKRRYKSISFQGEFAPELQFVLPFAYWHYLNGTLMKTQSSRYTRELYFFSPDHEETFDIRTNEGNYNFEIPRILYSQDYDIGKWAQVPLKAKYRNDVYLFEKPLLVVANRYNMEWGQPPISFFSIGLLSYLFTRLGNDYSIVYNRPRPQNITMDNSDIYDLNEYDWIRAEFPGVILMEDLYAENRGKAASFNHLQLQVYANATKFLSIHGGTATLASYFGGTNIILSKKGPEHHFRCFEKLYPQFSDAVIYHAASDGEVRDLVEKYYLQPPVQ